MDKVNLMKLFPDYYSATEEIEEVSFERGLFLCTDGMGDPVGETVKSAIDMLYGVVYRIRSELKKTGRMDFQVPKLEFRWIDDPHLQPKSKPRWRFMLRVSDKVTRSDLIETRKALSSTKGIDASNIRLVFWREGRALQVLRKQSSDSKGDICDDLQSRADELGYRIRGGWHTIYLGNPNKEPLDRIRRIIQLPIAYPRPEYAYGRIDR